MGGIEDSAQAASYTRSYGPGIRCRASSCESCFDDTWRLGAFKRQSGRGRPVGWNGKRTRRNWLRLNERRVAQGQRLQIGARHGRAGITTRKPKRQNPAARPRMGCRRILAAGEG
jgi:hypothetical protein